MFTKIPPPPQDTARASEESFGNDHPYIRIGDSLERILSEVSMVALDAVDTKLGDPFWYYAFATVLQYREGLTDRQMANATRTRVDLKYALRLPLFFPGINSALLCIFRQKLQGDRVSMEIFQHIVDQLSRLIDNQEEHLTDAGYILAAICTNSRQELVIETMSNAVEALATYFPEWLRSVALPSWYQRYSYRQTLHKNSRSSDNLKETFSSVGEDGQHLLECIKKSANPELLKLPEIRTLRQEWRSQFEIKGGQFILRSANCLNCANLSQSLFG